MTCASDISVPALAAGRRWRAWIVPVLGVLVFLPFLVCAGVYGYCKLFSMFQSYDDEGYMMISLANFQKGLPLYDQVFTQYGPFYYWASWAAFKIGHLHLDHTSVRALTLLMWLASAVLLAVFTQRMTRSVGLCVLVFVATFLQLGVVANEPGHPQALAGLLTVLAVVLVPFLLPREATGKVLTRSAGEHAGATGAAQVGWLSRASVVPLTLGVLTAALGFTKTNLGVFLFLAVALLLVSLAPPHRRRRGMWLTIILGLALLVLPTALMRTHLKDPSATWAQTYRLLTTLAPLPVLALLMMPALRRTGRGEREPVVRMRSLLWFAGGLFVTALLLSVLTILRGTSLYGLAYGLVLMHIRFASIFFVPAPIPDFCRDWAWASLAVFGVYGLACFVPVLRGIVTFLLELAFGIVTFTLALFPHVHGLWLPLDRLLQHLAGLGRYHHAGLLLGVAAPFLWIVLLPRRGESARFATARVGLVLIALLQTLMAYPVGGSQMAYATVLLLPAAGLALADAACLVDGVVAPLALARSAARTLGCGLGTVTVVSTGLLCYLGTSNMYVYYTGRPSLNLPGARSLHLDEPHCAAFQWAAYNIRQADTLFTFTGQNSFHFFSGVPSPTTFNVTMWPTQLTPEQQRGIVDSLGAPGLRPIVLQSAELTENRPQYDGYPLVDYIKHTLLPRGTVLGFTLRTRPDWSPALTYSAFLQATPPTAVAGKNPDVSVTLVLPAMPHRKAQVLMLCDLFRAGDLATTPEVGDRSLTVYDESGRALPLYATTIDLSTPRRLTLVAHAPNLWNDIAHAGFAVVRLFNEKKEPVASVPFVHD